MKLTKKQEKPEKRDVFADFFDEFFNDRGLRTEAASLTPAVDVMEEKDKYLITADLPGLKQEDINVEVDDNILKISGERKEEKEEKEKKYHYVERSYGSFARSFTLLRNADAEKIKANYKNGELKLEVPKTEEAKPKKISVE